MEQSNRRESPPPRVALREPVPLLREIARAYEDEIAAVTDYTYGQILLQKYLPAVASLFAAIAKTEMHHYHALGELLRDLGASHALHTSIRNTPFRLNEDADSHAPVVARRILNDRIRDEKNAAAGYKKMAAVATTERARSLLSSLAADEEDHAAILKAMEARLAFS